MAFQWEYKALKLASKVVCSLSYSTVISLGKWLGPIYMLAAKKQVNRALTNVKRAFDCSDEEAQAIVKSHFTKLTLNMVELLYMPKVNLSFIDKHIEVRGLVHLKEAIGEDKGVIILTAHIGNWEWLGAVTAQLGFPTTTIVKNQPNAQITRFINEQRRKAGLEVFARDGADLIRAAKAMKQKKLLGFLADQDGLEQGMPIPFLGAMSSAPMGPAVFAKRFKAPVVPMFITRKEGGHIIHILPPFHYDESLDDLCAQYKLTDDCVHITEKFIYEHPTEWLWFQHRWRTKESAIENLEEKLACRRKLYEEK